MRGGRRRNLKLVAGRFRHLCGKSFTTRRTTSRTCSWRQITSFKNRQSKDILPQVRRRRDLVPIIPNDHYPEHSSSHLFLEGGVKLRRSSWVKFDKTYSVPKDFLKPYTNHLPATHFKLTKKSLARLRQICGLLPVYESVKAVRVLQSGSEVSGNASGGYIPPRVAGSARGGVSNISKSTETARVVSHARTLLVTEQETSIGRNETSVGQKAPMTPAHRDSYGTSGAPAASPFTWEGRSVYGRTLGYVDEELGLQVGACGRSRSRRSTSLGQMLRKITNHVLLLVLLAGLFLVFGYGAYALLSKLFVVGLMAYNVIA